MSPNQKAFIRFKAFIKCFKLTKFLQFSFYFLRFSIQKSKFAFDIRKLQCIGFEKLQLVLSPADRRMIEV